MYLVILLEFIVNDYYIKKKLFFFIHHQMPSIALNNQN